MKNNLINNTTFEHNMFGALSTWVDHEGEVWFVGKEVAQKLGYRDPAYAIATHCKGVSETHLNTKGGVQVVKIIPERDVYRLVMRSKLPDAERFEEWVVADVLPNIRKTGSYALTAPTPAQMSRKEILLLALAAEERAEQAEQLAQQKQEIIEHKDAVISGLTGEVTLAQMRSILNALVRRGGMARDRWRVLYKQFSLVYHKNVSLMAERLGCSKLDYIDQHLKMLPELYAIACKLFETDISAVKAELFGADASGAVAVV